MKKLLFITFLVLSACTDTSDTDQQAKKETKKEVLIEIKDGIYTEWYPGKKQIKYKGGQDANKKRQGIWTFYAENGMELSVTMYDHGIRNGHTIVKYPSGSLHYRGEYMNDQTVGLWTTYDEKGNLLSEKDFGYPQN